MKQTRELLAELFKASGDEQDRRFRNWAKFVEKVDQSIANGYAFIGDLVHDGTIEVEIKPQLFLVASVAGSMKYHSTTYTVVEMKADGSLTETAIHTTDEKPGWALRIRDRVADMLAQMQAAAPQIVASDPLTAIRAEVNALAQKLAALPAEQRQEMIRILNSVLTQ